MQPTDEQKLIIDSKSDLLIVNAMAGTGKTSTLVQFCKQKKEENPNVTFVYFAFNASMGSEAKKSFESIGENMRYCGTMHSYALKRVNNASFYQDRIKKKEILRFFHIQEIINTDKPKVLNSLLNVFREFVKSGEDFDSFLVFDEDISEYDLENLLDVFGSKKEIRKQIKSIWNRIDTDSNMPYEHDFYLKKYQLEGKRIGVDYILVDEAQDLNPVMLKIVANQNAKKVLVGDTHQQIYSFRGCVNALERMSGLQGAENLYLTKTFRCPQHIVEKVVPYLELLGVPKERMLSGFEREKDYPSEKDKKTIIFRTNAGIFDFLANNQDLKVSFVGGLSSYDFKKIIDVGLSLSDNEVARSRIRDDFLRTLSSKAEFLEYLKDYNDVELNSKFNIFLKYVKKEDFNIFDFIKNNIKDSGAKAEVLLTTAHKSKGLEWDYVELYDDFPPLRKIAEQKDKKEKMEVEREELNLLYVAITRAKKLITIPQMLDLSDKRDFEVIREKLIIAGEQNA